MQLQWELAEAQAEAQAAEKRAQEALDAKAALQQSAGDLAQKVQDARTQTERTANEVFVTLRSKVLLTLPCAHHCGVVLFSFLRKRSGVCGPGQVMHAGYLVGVQWLLLRCC